MYRRIMMSGNKINTHRKKICPDGKLRTVYTSKNSKTGTQYYKKKNNKGEYRYIRYQQQVGNGQYNFFQDVLYVRVWKENDSNNTTNIITFQNQIDLFKNKNKPRGFFTPTLQQQFARYYPSTIALFVIAVTYNVLDKELKVQIESEGYKYNLLSDGLQLKKQLPTSHELERFKVDTELTTLQIIDIIQNDEILNVLVQNISASFT